MSASGLGRVKTAFGGRLTDYIAEITGFPGTKFDDQVDSTTQALAYMREPNDLEIWRKFGENAPHVVFNFGSGRF
jgi:hypothetical protein